MSGLRSRLDARASRLSRVRIAALVEAAKVSPEVFAEQANLPDPDRFAASLADAPGGYLTSLDIALVAMHTGTDPFYVMGRNVAWQNARVAGLRFQRRLTPRRVGP